MHFTIATIVAASALLFPASLAAPLPNNDSGSAASCTNDSGSVISVGVGVGVGNSIYKPSNNVKVKQGDQGSCPSGWTRSLLEVDLCIQVGGNDHTVEKQSRPDPTHRAVHAPSPYWGAKSTTTSTHAHRSSHTSAPQKDEWTPRGGSSKKPTTSATPTEKAHQSTSRAPTSTSSGHKAAAKPTNSLASTRCPSGDGSLSEACLEVDTDPLYVGAGIKIGGDRSPPSTTSKGRSGSQTATPSPSGRCTDGTTYDTLLDVCVDIDTDPLYLGGGIKIGGSPQPQRSSTSASPTTGSQTSRPSANRPKDQTDSGRSEAQDDLPECNGENDPRAVLDLCVNVADLLGAKIKLGGSGNDAGSGPSRSSGSSSSSSRAPQATPHKAQSGKEAAPSKAEAGALPPCSGPDDPDALLDLCVQVGDLLGAGVKLGGSQGPDSSASNRSPNNAKASSPPPSDDNDGNILDLSLGNLLNAKIGSGSRTDPASATSESPSASPRKVKQTAPINLHPDSDREPSDSKATSKPKNNNATQRGGDDDDDSLVSVSVSARVQAEPSPTPKPRPTTSRAPTPTAQAANAKKSCPVGQILHLGICVEAEADVLGLVSASAAATVAV
ncbi:hypothetical protein JCM3766R1_004085 [Sporobolomyces carnicolor]